MSRQKITFLLFLMLMLSTSVFSQVKTTIVENVNATKAGLVHVLNRTGDTIILKSSSSIYRFSFLYHSQKESVLMDLDSKEAKIPLHHFEVGQYTVVAYREDAVYPISLNRVGAITKPIDAIADLEEDVLRASLSNDEQRKRNIKPRHNASSDTRLASVANKRKEAAEAKEREQRALIKRAAEDTARKNQALAEAKQKEQEQRELIKKEAEARSKQEHALAEANRAKAEREKADRQLAQIEANKQAIKERALAEKRREELRAIAEAERKEADARIANVQTVATEDNKHEKKEVKYNISVIQDGSVEKQTREEYRKENLRPNGLPYED
ncbi:hypothetical protein [Olleya sp. Hel_I_94]|uniref:hypothetical protein n=1 Tax=Olleya sp. Hel_I_94 TaxID=1250001 RepID=UPI0011A087B9|nr:hypothetical protein [Olleya sp. Hel_I_94]TVZ47263.1 hypothetical protein JM82_1864 [Olleya sp. Hel_I_94]